MRIKTTKGMGWLRDLPDHRDFTINQNTLRHREEASGPSTSVKGLIAKTKANNLKTKIPTKVDLRSYFPPVEDQGSLGSCTANAGVGLLEYFERRAFGKHIDASRLFLYKTTRNLLGWEGDTGAYLRSTMAAMALFGVPPEKYWSYEIEYFEEEPSAFCYSFAQNYRSLQYYRLDPNGASPTDTLNQIKNCLAAGLPSMFGFSVFESIRQAYEGGQIPFPGDQERQTGGHAVVAAGYDDSMVIENKQFGGKTKGAFMIRNSWGDTGDNGYYYLPYEYVLQGLAVDWWSLIKADWIDTGNFGL